MDIRGTIIGANLCKRERFAIDQRVSKRREILNSKRRPIFSLTEQITAEKTETVPVN